MAKKVNRLAFLKGVERPMLRLTSDVVPEIKDWKPGNKYRFYIEVEETAMEVGSEWDPNVPKDLVRASFVVESLAVDNEDEEAEDYEMEYGRRMDERNKDK
jgi:hypothetical protein